MDQSYKNFANRYTILPIYFILTVFDNTSLII